MFSNFYQWDSHNKTPTWVSEKNNKYNVSSDLNNFQTISTTIQLESNNMRDKEGGLSHTVQAYLSSIQHKSMTPYGQSLSNGFS